MPNENPPPGGAFPSLNLGSNTTPAPIPLIAPNNAGAFDEISQAADRFGQSLNDVATRATVSAAKTQGVAAAVAAGASGQVTPQDDATVFGQTYNEVAKQTMGVARQAALRQQMGDAFVANQDDPGALGKAFGDIQKGMGTSGFADLDAQLGGDFAVQRGDYMVRAAAQLRDRTIAQGKANFADTLDQGVSLLAQTAQGASFDDTGAQRVATAKASLVQGLAKYGPKEAFDVGSMHFDADPTRLDAVGVDDIERVSQLADKQSTSSWILGQNDRQPTAAAKAAFVTELKQRYASHDPLLAGLDGQTAEHLFDKLDTDTDKATVQERQALELHAKNARDQIDALKWGGSNYDPATMIAEAKASGDPGLAAEADFYASVDKSMRGVYKTVVGRSLGLIPEPGQGGIPGQALDASGAPIGPVAGPAIPPAGSGKFFAPVAGPITSGFGMRAQPTAGATSNHMGVDYGVPVGTPVSAAGDGVVVSAGPKGGYGNAVVIRHPDGTTTLYGHLSAVGVQPGQQVQAGQTIAASGATGTVTGPNLHFGHYDAQGHAMDPTAGLAAQAPAAAAAPAANPWATPPAGATPGSPAFIAWVNTRDGFNADPLKFVQGHGLAAVPPIIPQAGFSQDPAQAGNFAAAMRQRQALATTLQKTYAVPLRLFTSAEQDDLKSYLQQDPTAGIALARNLTAAIGVQGATAALREIGQNGQDSLTEIHLGNLAAMGKTTIVSAAADGMRLRAEGADIPKWQQANMPHVRDFDDVTKDIAPAFAFQPDVLQAVRNVADNARISDLRKGVVHPADYYMQSAAGSTNAGGQVYGGIATVNGAPTLLPAWMNRATAPDVLSFLGRGLAAGAGNGPVYANGQRMSQQDFASQQLVGRPDGSYALRNPRTNQLARRADGSVFLLHLDNARDQLATGVPGSVLR